MPGKLLGDDWPAHPADRLALLISGVFSPFVVLPVFIAVLISHRGWTLPEAAGWCAVAVGGMVGVPLVYIVVGVRRGTITDIHIQRREQRQGPFLAGILGAAVAGLWLQRVGSPIELQLGAAAMMINGILFMIVSRRWKISMHPSTVAACLTLCGLTVAPTWFWGLLVVPPIMWARVRRQRHDWLQGLAATILAVLLTGGMVLLYLRFAG